MKHALQNQMVIAERFVHRMSILYKGTKSSFASAPVAAYQSNAERGCMGEVLQDSLNVQ